MGNKAAASISTPESLSDELKVRSIGSGVLPVAISSIVAEYLSDSSSDYVKAALVGVQPITLCLSQNVKKPPAMFWSIGVVSVEHQWSLSDFNIDNKFSIVNQKACLHFLEQKNSNYCTASIEVLIVKLHMYKNFFANGLDDLRNTIIALQCHLKSIKHVVLFVEREACLIFCLKEVIDTVTRAPLSVDKSVVLFEIIDDLKTCWKKNYFNYFNVLAFYFKKHVQRKSEKYLEKFVISLDCVPNKEMFDKEAAQIVSNKIIWFLNVNRYNCNRCLPDYTRLCHAFYWDGEDLRSRDENRLQDSKEDPFCFQDNPFVERIVINSLSYGHAINLPRPTTPLTDTTPRSGLVEITLEGHSNAIHLTDLNNGYFPHLRHLCVIGGTITGHLDSHRVPSLKTLILKCGVQYTKYTSKVVQFHICDRVQPLLRCGRPWQLVATQTKGGWSFASYDESIANPQDEVKEDSTFSSASLHALPRIKELLLVGRTQKHFDEWQSQLKGSSSLEAAAKDHKDQLLVWKPQCVEKITLYCPEILMEPQFQFTDVLPEQPRILTSLECYYVIVEVDGAALPLLQLLDVHWGSVKVSGTFPHLQKLCFLGTVFQSQWQMDAPSLQNLLCHILIEGQNLSMCPKRLPHLSSLEIWLFDNDPQSCPVILEEEGDLGFPRLTRVVFGRNMELSPFFDQSRVHEMLHLQLTLNVLELPEDWLDVFWECETLAILLYVPKPENSPVQQPPIWVQLPFLPRVKTLQVIERNCNVVLNDDMPHLKVCSVPSPKSLGRYLTCPALQRICFTDSLSNVEKELCLDPATYMLFGARPREIIFAADYELHSMAWDVVSDENEDENEDADDEAEDEGEGEDEFEDENDVLPLDGKL